MKTKTLALLSILLLSGCATKRPPPAVEAPPPEPATELLPAWPGLGDADRTVLLGGWESEARTDHPLVGVRWNLAEGRPMSRTELLEEADRHRYLLIGEKHDNADHHRLQARIVGSVADPETIVAFEMLDEDDGPQIPTPFGMGATMGTTELSQVVADPQMEADRLAEAVGWADSGWPEFTVYRSLFATALKYGLTIVPAHPARERLKGAMMEGLESVDPVALEGLRLEREYTPEMLAAVEEHIQEVHCDQAPPSIIPAMVVGQRLKDAWMARALEQESVPEMAAQEIPRPAAILIAGGGHTRGDRGVPMFLDRPDDAYTIALVEVPRTGETVVPADFAGQADVLWFTPRVDDEDPCDKFAEELKKLGPVK